MGYGYIKLKKRGEGYMGVTEFHELYLLVGDANYILGY